jgi:hypothetical protein
VLLTAETSFSSNPGLALLKWWISEQGALAFHSVAVEIDGLFNLYLPMHLFFFFFWFFETGFLCIALTHLLK